jgi:ATP-dependent DNA ligase
VAPGQSAKGRLAYVVFDIAPRRTRSGPLPLVERKAILEKLIVTAGSGNRCSSGCEDRVAKEVRREKPR